MPDRTEARIQQIAFVLESLDEAAAHPPDWRERGDAEYLYREGCLLVRDADVDLVAGVLERLLGARRVLPDGQRVDGRREVPEGRLFVEGAHQGVTRLRYRNPRDDGRLSVPDVLDLLDAPEQLGRGTARPEAILYCCGHACPAAEPDEVPNGTFDPYPAPVGSCCGPPSDAGNGILVSVVDTGLVAGADQHPWLAGVQGDPEDTFEPGGGIRPYGGHGTFVAGCVRVTAPRAQIYVDGPLSLAGGAAGYETDIVHQLAEALDRSPDVVVFTFATRTRLSLSLLGFDALYESAIRTRKDLVVLAPAGNDGKRDVMWPAAYPWVVSVGALSANWQSRAHFSNFGGWVDVYAPGEDLVNAYATGTFTCREAPHAGEDRQFTGMARWSGTSFSTPLVAGMVAARMSATGENGRQAAHALLQHALSNAVPGVGPVLLPGSVDG
jgi:subtilisin family serine protease